MPGLADAEQPAPVVVLTFDPDVLGPHWIAEYAPEPLAFENRRMLTIDRVRRRSAGP